MLPWQPLFEPPFFWVQKVVTMAMYYITVKAPLTVPLYLYFASVSPWQNIDNGTVRYALTITYSLGNIIYCTGWAILPQIQTS